MPGIFFSPSFFLHLTSAWYLTALALNSGLGDGSVDLVFGVQWSWSEPEEKEDQMRALSDCVSRRLDQGECFCFHSIVYSESSYSPVWIFRAVIRSRPYCACQTRSWYSIAFPPPPGFFFLVVGSELNQLLLNKKTMCR